MTFGFAGFDCSVVSAVIVPLRLRLVSQKARLTLPLGQQEPV